MQTQLENLKLEMERMQLYLLEKAKMSWPDSGDSWSGNYILIHTGTMVLY